VARKKRAEKSNDSHHVVQLDIGTLSNHLWESANILRGPVDAADFKTYIFPLLFFKRISDVFDEELTVALNESNGDVEFAHFPENHRFQIPEGCHWNDVRAKSTNIGHALQKAMRCIEQANPDTLHGIFGDAQWTNKDRLYGQEKNLTTSSIARMNLFLHGAEDFHIERGDTLRLPAFYSGDGLATFDYLIVSSLIPRSPWKSGVMTPGSTIPTSAWRSRNYS
jgi:type I restriction-modification system DNA methylase subunit